MKLHEKMFWKIYNAVMARVLRLTGGTGLLKNKKDSRDRVNEELGAMWGYKTKYQELSHFAYQFNQNPLNICVFAGGILAVSEQTGVRFSVKFAVKLAKKLGMISGNGFSYQRAVLEIVTKYGLVPYEMMPDEINESWNEYSKWTPEAQRLLDEVAPHYKFTEYEKLKNEDAVCEAQDKGYVVITASNFYNENPQPPKWYLRFVGSYLGGHQYRSTGYRLNGFDFEIGNTYGKNWGKNGTAFVESLFGRGKYDNWIVNYEKSPMLPTELLLPLFLKQNEGKMVKKHDRYGDPKCFVIQDGVKHHVKGDDDMKTYHSLFNKVGLTYVNSTLLDATPEGEQYPYEV